MLFPYIFVQPHSTSALHFYLVVTVGFIGAPYFVIESDGMASLTIGLIQGQLAVPVTLNVQLVNGSAQGWICRYHTVLLKHLISFAV